MKTFNRPTASTFTPSNDLRALSHRARSLWAREPGVTGHERERHLSDLADVDLTIERLSLRTRRDHWERDDYRALANSAERLERLERLWSDGPQRLKVLPDPSG